MGERHITKVARSLIGKLKIKNEESLAHQGDSRSVSARTLYLNRGPDVLREVRKMRPENLGRILAQAPSVDELNNEQLVRPSESILNYFKHPFSNQTSGRKILQTLTALALITEMANIFRPRDLDDGDRFILERWFGDNRKTSARTITEWRIERGLKRDV